MTCIRIVRGAFLVSVRIRIIKHSIETIFQTSLILNFIKKFQVRDFLRYINYINIKFQQFQFTRRMPRFWMPPISSIFSGQNEASNKWFLIIKLSEHAFESWFQFNSEKIWFVPFIWNKKSLILMRYNIVCVV